MLEADPTANSDHDAAGSASPQDRRRPVREEWYHALFENSLSGILIADPPTGEILAANPEACRMLGYTEAQLCALQRSDIIDTTEARYATALATRLQTGMFRGELTFRRADGTLFPVELTSTLFTGSDGQRVGLQVFSDISERKAAEAAVRASEDKYRSLFEAAGDGLAHTDNNGCYLEVNARYAAMLQRWPSELVGRPVSDFVVVTPEQWADANAQLVAQRTVTFERQFRRADGSLLPVDITVTLLPDNYRLNIVRDITERKRMEDALLASEARLKAVVENSSDMIWSVDRNYRLLVANTACIEGTASAYGHGILPGESLVESALSLEVRQFWKHHYDCVFAGESVKYEFPSTVRAGATMVCYLDPLHDADGVVMGAVGRIADITEYLEAQAQLRATVQRLHLAADAAGIGIWNWNFADDTLEWDDRMCELYGVPKSTRDHVIYYDVWRSSLHPDDLVNAETTLQAAARAGTPWQTCFRIVQPDGTIRHIQASSVIDYDRKGLPLRMIGINRDVTEQMTYQQFLQDANVELEERVAERTRELRSLVGELERANAGKDAFLAAVSHELRTPLAGILGVVETLQSEVRGPLNEYQRRYVGAIRNSGDRLLAMVISILNYTFAMSDNNPVEIRTCRLAELCLASVKTIRPKADHKQQKIAVDINPLNLQIRSNSDDIMLILDALLDNAIKFTPNAGEIGIDISLVDAGQAVQITVWDTGIGIAPEQMDYLFRPLTQIDQRLAREYEGIGLGLALVKRKVERLSGTVSVESTPGAGSRFAVTLPSNISFRR